MLCTYSSSSAAFGVFEDESFIAGMVTGVPSRNGVGVRLNESDFEQRWCPASISP